MNPARWSALFLAAAALTIPGCLLVQPLDDAKSDTTGNGGTTSTGGSGAGKAGAGPSPSGGKAGAGPSPGGGMAGADSDGTAGDGQIPAAGAPNTVDFSYFTGTWTVTSGTITTDCGTGPKKTTPDTGTKDVLTLGTTSDLIVDEGTQCAILIDVMDLVGTAQDGQSCDFSDAAGSYHLEVNYFDFTVDDSHQTATSSLLSVITYTTNGVDTICDSDQELVYTR